MDQTHVHTLVVGAGFGGLCTAVKLQAAGEPDFLVLERGSDVGGTWRDNTYPGAACDVPSQLYSFSFAPNRHWTRSFSAQPEILSYLRRVARESEVLDRFRFDTSVEHALWDDAQSRWHVRTSAGDLTADLLVSAAGALSEPRLPDIDGLDVFKGELFHSARWRHDVNLAGKRVAVIGTGASAIQIVPELAPVAEHVDVYQRSAPYVIPRSDRRYTRLERSAFRHVPAVQKAYRTGIYWGREALVPGFVTDARLATPARVAALANIERGIGDPDLRERVRPTYAIGCKRILVSNDWYPALARDDVDLVTDPVAGLTADGVVTRDATGRRTVRDAEVLVVATGFRASDPPIAHRVVGRDGRTMAEHFAERGMSAYKGATVHGFPNFFFVVGPNTGLGHSSMVLMIEAQAGYLVDAVRAMRAAEAAAVEPTIAAQEAWNHDLQRRMRRTVWTTGGCSSWYLDAHGRNVTLWPRTTYTFRRLTARFDTEAYTAVRAPARARAS
jgi:cation diffusion facilitator CzcD-associated flavoprotein CzcO